MKLERHILFLSFLLASSALIGSGIIIQSSLPTVNLLLIIASNFCGVYIVYRFNLFLGTSSCLNEGLMDYFNNWPNRIILLLFFGVLFPINLFWLDGFRFMILSIIGIIGIAYALPFKTIGLHLKKICGIKNILIGFSWGLLILVGAGKPTSVFTLQLFLLATIQVIIGSIIRDFADVQHDEKMNVNSLPVVIGRQRTLYLLLILNLICLAIPFLINYSAAIFYTTLFVCIWRVINLLFLFKNSTKFLTQYFNLYTCILIFLVLLINLQYGSV